MNIESGLITKLKTKEDVLLVIDERITIDFFVLYGDVFNDVIEHFKNYGTVPTQDILLLAYPDFEFIEYEQPLKFFIDKIKEQHKSNILKKGVGEIIKAMKKSTDEAEKLLQKTLFTVKSEIKTGEDLDVRTSIEQAKADYLKKKESFGVDGYVTGWAALDTYTCGWHPGDFACWIAEPKMGKTWLLLHEAVTAWKEEEVPILFLTKEIQAPALRKRFDAINCRLSYNDLRKGMLSPFEEERYFKYLEDMQYEEIPFVILGHGLNDKGTTVSSLIPKVERYLPDGGILFVDGIYMMDDDRGESDWKAIVNIARDLKDLALQYKIPVISTSQAQIQGKGYIPEAENVAYGKYLGQFVDLLGAFYRKAEYREADLLMVKTIFQREGNAGNFLINFKFDPIDFSQCYNKEVERDESDDEEEYTI